MMLAEASSCQHPPLWNCNWCCGCDASPLVSVSNGRWGIRCPKGHCKVKRALKIHKSNHTCRLKPAVSVLPENASFSTVPIETSVNELTGTLGRLDSASADFNNQSDTLSYNTSTVELPDSLVIDQVHDEEPQSPLIGPCPGDLAEVEAFCRIFRIAEQVHNAVMDALRVVNDAREQFKQQSGGYALTDFQNSNDLENIDLSLLEEKVVAGLGCIGALLHREKQEVLGGRLNLGSASIAQPHSVPPLAQFRAAMKRCCEQLESALYRFFPASEMQFASMHSKFQKLKNVCYDTGLPRAEGSPSHADIPNWGPVRLWTPRVDRSSAEVVFWKGGQVTEEGVRWLLDNGFKVIVDIRAEDSVDQLTKLALNAAVSSGKLKHVRLPVEQGETPTKDQVFEFAKLVADPQNHPLYLHSQEGVGRTSMMVARWREVVLRNASRLDSPVQDVLSHKVGQELADTSSQPEAERILDTGDQGQVGSMKQELSDANYSEPRDQQIASVQDTATAITPFEAQRPVLNFFSKQAMSKFLKGRRISPTTFRSKKRIVKVVKSDGFQGEDPTPSLTSIADPAGRWALDGPGIPRAGIKEKKSSSFDLEGNEENETLHRTSNVQESAERCETCDEEVASSANVVSFSATSDNGHTKGALFRVSGVETPPDDSEEPIVAGDMCASTTGVVRVQSRRKAEMYLVRTDGFSCTRERVKESTLAFTHPSTQQQMLMWKTAPKTVLLLKKLGNELMQEAQQVASFLHYQEGMNVIVEPEVHDRFARVPGFGFVQTFYNQDTSALHERVDFVVCLGGDGVILHASNIFRNAVPPVVSFNLGSLGFLTAHPFEDFVQDLRAIIHGNNRVEGVYITLRMRLRCELFRNGKSIPGKVFDVLNEVVVDRGSNPYLCKIECFERNRLITKVQADGVIVATPTGSTAYSTAAGGSMVHPNVPCMLFTPICPHSLSFRPVILPDSALLELKVPNDARSNAWVSFDGKRRQQLSRGDSVRVCMSEHPLPTVNKSDQTDDWFRSLVRCLNWNERLEQKALTASS